MAEFICKLGTPTGQVIERVYTAQTEEDLRRDFETQDFLIFSIRKKAAAAALLDFTTFKRKRISAKEFLIFNQELASLISAGLPIISSLDILIERRKNPVFKQVLADIRDQVKSGGSLSEAFESHGDLFPRLYASALASGERSGEIVGVLRRYISYSKTVMTLRKKVTSALVYPMILVTMAIGLVILMVTVILPKFQEFFTGMQADLPFVTVALLSVAGWVSRYLFILVPLFAVAVGALITYKKSEAGTMAWDQYKMKIPFLGPVFSKYAISRFCRTLATLVQGGIPLVTSLEISARAVGNLVFEKEMMTVARKVREGQPLHESLEKTGVMTDMAVEMIKVGESTGSLEEMLSNVSNFYDEEIDTDLSTIVSLMEPALLIFMGAVVATMILAIYLPLLKSTSLSQT
ncbi:MAG TPA: type II secretion system F family protein [Patescibacteria group bacterium]|jgi:type IV pilus assembly protein PilC|nr:type II secretion system F family protein [Patescibacteria group bacterium]